MIDRARYSSKAWRRLRRQAFERDCYRCRTCNKAGRLEADHVIPVHKDGAFWDMGNLQALCRGCHIRKSAGENSRRKRAEMPEHQKAWISLVQELCQVNSKPVKR